jgi:hypothetical protein
MRLFLSELEHKRHRTNFACAMTWLFQPECALHTMNF